MFTYGETEADHGKNHLVQDRAMLEPWNPLENPVGQLWDAPPPAHTLESSQHDTYNKVQDGVAHAKGAQLHVCVCIPQNYLHLALDHSRTLPVYGGEDNTYSCCQAALGNQTPFQRNRPSIVETKTEG